MRPYLNKVAVPNFEGKCSTEIVPLLPNSDIEREYLAYFLRSGHVVDLISSRTAGARMPRADMDFIFSLPILLPPRSEQRRIVDLLSRAEGIVRLRRDAEQKAAELIPALFLDMFGDPATNPKGWPMARLGDLAEKMSDGPFGSNLKTSHYVEVGVRVIRLQNIGIGELIDDAKAYVSPKHFASLPRHRCQPDDVIIGTLGDPNLRAFVLPSTISEALNKADCVQFRCRQGVVSPAYICWLMNMPSTLAMAASLVQGITLTRISMGRLREMIVPSPPFDVQQAFADLVEMTNGIKSQQSTATTKAQATFDALLAQVFTT
ncbi:MAG: restriction endonuclease subunit S [Sterolibacterium sp.]|nr:restriction endonuclease subunit S [Sterolibacterium sp.]